MNKGFKNPIKDVLEVGVSPFESGLVIPINKSYSEVRNKFGDVDVKESDMEATKFTKVYDVSSNRDKIVGLPIRCKELWLYIIHSLEIGQDYIWIDRRAYMDNMGIKSINTFKLAINKMCESVNGQYLQKHSTIKDVYWINPVYIFKGSRINKYPNRLKIMNDVRVKKK